MLLMLRQERMMTSFFIAIKMTSSCALVLHAFADISSGNWKTPETGEWKWESGHMRWEESKLEGKNEVAMHAYAFHWRCQCTKSSHKHNNLLYNPGHYIIMYIIVNTDTKLLLCAAKVYAHMLWIYFSLSIYLHLCLLHTSAHAGFFLCSVRLFVL